MFQCLMLMKVTVSKGTLGFIWVGVIVVGIRMIMHMDMGDRLVMVGVGMTFLEKKVGGAQKQ